MKKRLFFLTSSLLLLVMCGGISCGQTSTNKEKQTEKADTAPIVTTHQPAIGTPLVELKTIIKDFSSFWAYFNAYALLHQDLPAMDQNGKTIDKGLFLEKLNTGRYLPLVVYGKDGIKTFKLAVIPKSAPKDIGLITMNYANRELNNYRMEGKPVPKFNFTDINGHVYTAENTLGKIVLFKCWFITCVACVQEMPALNKLVDKYKDRKDILFISLAIDEKKPLQQFLAKTKFDYTTVPNQKAYMEEKLHVQLYPTHVIINKKGLVVKVPPNEYELEKYLEREVEKEL